MNKEELAILDKCVKALTMISDKLETVFKAVEVIQTHLITTQDVTRINNISTVFDSINILEEKIINKLEKFEKKIKESDNKKTKLSDMSTILYNRINKLEKASKYITRDDTRRLDRLEEGLSTLIGSVYNLNMTDTSHTWLRGLSKELYEEQAAAKGDQDE